MEKCFEIDEKQKVYDHYIPHEPVKLDTGTETIVEQHHEETTNINKIIGRYRRSGVLPPGREGHFSDVSEVGELLDVQMKLEEAKINYENLPENIKEKLPFADIGNVSNETLQEMFNALNGKADEADGVQTPAETKEDSGKNESATGSADTESDSKT